MTNSPRKLERRCPRLGGAVAFDYCLHCEADNRPCGKIMDCWWEIFDVVEYLRRNLSEDEFRQIAESRPKPKLTSLIELIEQAKARTGSGSSHSGT